MKQKKRLKKVKKNGVAQEDADAGITVSSSLSSSSSRDLMLHLQTFERSASNVYSIWKPLALATFITAAAASDAGFFWNCGPDCFASCAHNLYKPRENKHVYMCV